jgi:hypothetical protein
VHLSKKEKAKDLVAISGEIGEWGFKVSNHQDFQVCIKRFSFICLFF